MNYEVSLTKNNMCTLPVCALGSINYDFETEEHRDSFIQLMSSSENPTPDPYDPKQILEHLIKNPCHAASLIWTITYDCMPICAIKPTGIFTWYGYVILKNFLTDKINNHAPTISISGTISGSVDLIGGNNIPIIIPDLTSIMEDLLVC